MKHQAFALAILLIATNAHADVKHVWAVSDGDKIERDAQNHPLRLAALAWLPGCLTSGGSPAPGARPHHAGAGPRLY